MPLPLLAALLPAVIGGAASIGGALIGKSSADKAAKAATKRDAQVRADFAPYREAGTNYLAGLDTAYGMGDPATLDARRAEFQTNFENSPLYRNTFLPALETSIGNYNKFASAAGQLNSGGTLRALQDRAAKLGAATFGDYIAGMEGRANQGQAAAGQTVAGTQPAFEARQSAYGDAGNALASGVLGVGNAAMKGLDNYSYLKGLSAYSNPQLTGAGARLY